MRAQYLWAAIVWGVICGSAVSGASADVKAPERIVKAGKIVFCTELANPPWEMIDPATQQPAGFDIDLAASVSKAMGVTNEHKNIAFDGLIPALQAGQCDAIISGLYNKPKRREIVDFVDYAFSGNSVIAKADSTLAINSLSDLSGKKVSVGVGTALEQELKQANEELKTAGKPLINIVAMPSTADAIQQLIAGLSDAYYGSTDQVSFFNKERPGFAKLVSPQLSALYTGIATLHKDKDLHEAFAAALKAIMTSGEYQAVLTKWGFEGLKVQ